MKRQPGQGPAPALAAEEQQRGDNLVAVAVELMKDGQNAQYHQMAARDAYETAAAHGEQPTGWSR